jgi:hypothetical protein
LFGCKLTNDFVRKTTTFRSTRQHSKQQVISAFALRAAPDHTEKLTNFRGTLLQSYKI